MNIMNGDLRAERERKRNQNLVSRVLSAYLEQAVDESKADTKRFS